MKCKLKMHNMHMYRYIVYKNYSSKDKLPKDDPYVKDALEKHENNKKLFVVLDKLIRV
jgi:hypothetical protein